MNTDRCDHKVKKFFPYSFSLFHFLLPSLHLPRSSFITDHLSPYYLLLPSFAQQKLSFREMRKEEKSPNIL